MSLSLDKSISVSLNTSISFSIFRCQFEHTDVSLDTFGTNGAPYVKLQLHVSVWSTDKLQYRN